MEKLIRINQWDDHSLHSPCLYELLYVYGRALFVVAAVRLGLLGIRRKAANLSGLVVMVSPILAMPAQNALFIVMDRLNVQ